MTTNFQLTTQIIFGTGSINNPGTEAAKLGQNDQQKSGHPLLSAHQLLKWIAYHFSQSK